MNREWALRIYDHGKLQGFLASHGTTNRLKVHALPFTQQEAKAAAADINSQPENQRNELRAVPGRVWRRE